MINHEKNLLFIHVPKTAGSAITYTYPDCFEVPGPGVNTHRRIEDFDVDPGKYWKFCVVRNPWEMVVSWYAWHRSHGDKRKSMEVAAFKVDTPRFFGAERMDAVLRFETLQKDLDRMLERFKIERRPLRQMNKSEHGDYREYYTDRLREIVADRFAWEIREYGYEF
jgi:hypothetical protein